jgi:serine/alanine adding enzyme
MIHLETNPDKVNKQQWHDFVKLHPNGNIFQSPEMYEVHRNTPLYTPIFLCGQDQSTEIVFILVAVLQKEHKGLTGKFSARSIIIGGPLIKDKNEDYLELCIKFYIKIINNQAIYTQIRNFYIHDQATKQAFQMFGFEYEDHLNIVLNISSDENELFDQFSKSRRKGIKKAFKHNFVFSESTQTSAVDDFYSLLSLTYDKIKLPYPSKKHFSEITKILNADNFRIFFLTQEEHQIASLFVLSFNKTIYGYYIGSATDNEILKYKPLDLLFWQVFKWGISHGYSSFDWMGAGKPDEDYGVRDFKLQYGGKAENFGRYVKIHKPFLMQVSKVLFKIWQKI